MEAGLCIGLIVAVQRGPDARVVRSEPSVHRDQVGTVRPAIVGHAGRTNGGHDQLVHRIRRTSARRDLAGRNLQVQARIGGDDGDQIIQSRGRAANRIRIHRRIAERAVGQVVPQQAGQPRRHDLDAGVGVAVLVEQLAALDFEAQVVDAVGDRIDGVVVEQPRGRAVVLHQVEAGLLVILVVAVQRDPRAAVVRAEPRAEVADIRRVDRAVVGQAGRLDRQDDQIVHGVCGPRPRHDFAGGQTLVQAGIGQDDLDQPIQSRASRADGIRIDLRVAQRAGVQVGSQQALEPVRDAFNACVAVAVLIQELAVHDLESHVIDAVRDRVDGLAIEQPRARAVVLHQVEARLPSRLVITVQRDPFGRVPPLNPGVQIVQVRRVQPAVVGEARFLDRVDDQVVHRVRRSRSLRDVGRVDVLTQARIGQDHVDQAIESGAGRALRRSGGQHVDRRPVCPHLGITVVLEAVGAVPTVPIEPSRRLCAGDQQIVASRPAIGAGAEV